MAMMTENVAQLRSTLEQPPQSGNAEISHDLGRFAVEWSVREASAAVGRSLVPAVTIAIRGGVEGIGSDPSTAVRETAS